MSNKLRRGISTLCLFKERFERVIEEIEGLSEEVVWEIIDEGLHRLTKERIKELKDLGREYTIHSPFSDLNTATLNEECRRTYMKIYLNSIRNAYMLSSRVWILHAGFKSPLGYFFPQREWENNVSFIKALARQCEEHGLNLLIENLAGKALIKSVSEFERLFSEVSGEFIGVCLDIGHLNLVVGDKWSEFIDRLHKLIKSTHLHDNNGRLDEHLALGCGNVEWKTLLEALVRKGFNGYLVAENYKLEDSLETLRKVEGLINSLT